MEENISLIYNSGINGEFDEKFQKLHELINHKIFDIMAEGENRIKDIILSSSSLQDKSETVKMNEIYSQVSLCFDYRQKALDKLEEAYMFVNKAISYV